MKIYVGNLTHEVTEEELREEFQTFGQVATVDIIKDKFTGRPKGFAFVEMPTVSEGQAAIAGLSGKVLQDRTITVNTAIPTLWTPGSGSSSRHGTSPPPCRMKPRD